MGKIGLKHISKLEEYRKLTDLEIIDLAIKGKEEAFTILVNRYKQALITYISDFIAMGKVNALCEIAEEPQDICQEALQKAFKNIATYNADYSFSTWLYNIAQNTAIDYYRRRKIDIEPEALNDNKISAAGNNPKNSPEDSMISNQEYLTLIQHIDNLPDKYRIIARLRFIKEYAIEEISKLVKLPPNTVKTRIKRAKALIYKEYEDGLTH